MSSPRAMRAALVFLSLSLLIAACVPHHRAPVPGARLAVGAETFADEGPFRVTFAGPKGETTDPREITISFSRPLASALGSVDRPLIPATVTRTHDGAKVEGTWRWFAERTAVFWPKAPFARATEIRVAVDPGLRALDGTPLADAPSFAFAGPRPALESVAYAYDDTNDSHDVTLDFNQPIPAAKVTKSIRLRGRGARGVQEIPFHVIGLETESQQKLHVDRIIASLEDVTVIADESLGGDAGPLLSGVEVRMPVPEVGPLHAEIQCHDAGEDPPAARSKSKTVRCAADAGNIRLSLSKAVPTKDLLRHVVVSPPVPIKTAWDAETTQDLDLSYGAELEPGRKYRVTITAGLRSTDREVLAADRVMDLEIADHEPSVRFRDIGREAIVESARPSVNLELQVMNVPAIDVVRAPLDEAQLFDLLLAHSPSAAHVSALPGSVPLRLNVAAKKNAGAATRFDLPPSMRAAGTAGTFAVATSTKGLPDDVRILSVTDLGVTSKWSPHGGLVWITRLSSSAPVANASVSLRRVWQPATPDARALATEVYTTTTDAAGVATIPSQVAAAFLETRDVHPEAILIVKDGADRTYTRLPPLDPSLAQAIGDVFTERRLYRPGETAYVKGVFRAPTPRGLVSLVGRPASVEALDDDDRVLFATTVTLDSFGAFSCEMPIPRTTRLGSVKVHARLGAAPARRPTRGRYGRAWWADGWSRAARFLVDEYRSVDFKVEVEADRAHYQRSETARITARGKYLMGAPMHDVPVAITVTRQPTSFAPPGLEGFVTDAHALVPSASERIVDVDPMLAANGSAELKLPLAQTARAGPEQLTVAASIPDVSRAFEAGDDTSFVVHPSDLYVGARVRSRVFAGEKVRVEIAAALRDGTRQAGKLVHVELQGGSACDVRTTTEVVACDLPVAERGVHSLRASTHDARGDLVTAGLSIDVAKERTPPLSKPLPAERPPEPQAPSMLPPPFDDVCRAPAKPDHPILDIEGWGHSRTFVPGEKAHTCLRGAGHGLLTVEREGVLRYELYRLAPVGKLVDLPITADLDPSATIVLHDVRGRTSPFPTRPNESGSDRPSSTTNALALRVHAAEKKLSLQIETDTEYRPGAEVVARVKVRDGSNAPAMAQVTLWAVDEGAFLLRPFSVPKLEDTFGAERDSDVMATDTRELLLWEKVGVHRTKSPSLRTGATQSGPGDHIGRAASRPTAWFLPSLVTGPDGIATAKVKLPDNLTTWKLFAVAATPADGFGSAESSFRTNKPLMARPALPRFLRVGDRVDATVVVDSMIRERLEVKVSMRASGAVAVGTSGANVKTIALPPDGHVPVHFSLEAKTVGRGSVSFHVEAPGTKLADDVTIDEEVTAPAAHETIVVSGETRTRADEPLGDLSRVRADAGGFDFRLAASPMVGVADSLTALVEYPYGCTEQLTSRLVPLVRLRSLARELGVALPRDVDGAVRSAVASLLSHQRSDGGFGFWPSSHKSEAWLTIAALSALSAAADAGYVVPPAPMDRATAYLEKTEQLDLPSRAMLEDLSASRGRPREAQLRALAAEIEKGPLFARALVAHALAKVDRDLGKRILEGVAGQARISGSAATIPDEAAFDRRRHLSSDARTTAMVLRAFVVLDPQNPLVTKLVRGLLGQRREGRWPTTQASAWALLALDEARSLFAVPAVPITARLSLDGTAVGRATFPAGPGGAAAAFTGTIPMSRLALAQGASLSFTSEGGPLFYEGALRYARRELPTTALEHGIHVTKTMRVLRGNDDPIATTDYRVGDYVEVDVVLASPTSRELVVLDDPIPAGFEAVNQSFANATRRPFRADASKNVTHRELRDDRVVTFFDELPAGQEHTSYVLRVTAGGRYAVPPAKAECMYAPDVFGRTGATVVNARP